MGASWEEVDGLSGLQRIAAFPQKLDVAGERRGIARDVDDAPRTHRGHRLDDIRADALARRIDDDDVGPFSFGREHLRGLPGVHAVKFRLIREAVAFGVLLRVLNGLRHNLHADGRPASRARQSVIVPVPQ